MKKQYLLLLLIIGILFSSCRKDDDSNDKEKYYVKLKINNTQMEDHITGEYFDENSIFEKVTSNTYAFQIFSYIKMTINQSELETKTYSFKVNPSNYSENSFWFNYDDPATGTEYSTQSSDATGSMTLNITSIKDNNLKGTFSGTIVAKSTGNGTIKTFNITNGEFYVPLQ